MWSHSLPQRRPEVFLLRQSARDGPRSIQGMDNQTLLIIIVVILLLGGGGVFYRRR